MKAKGAAMKNKYMELDDFSYIVKPKKPESKDAPAKKPFKFFKSKGHKTDHEKK